MVGLIKWAHNMLWYIQYYIFSDSYLQKQLSEYFLFEYRNIFKEKHKLKIKTKKLMGWLQ